MNVSEALPQAGAPIYYLFGVKTYRGLVKNDYLGIAHKSLRYANSLAVSF